MEVIHKIRIFHIVMDLSLTLFIRKTHPVVKKSNSQYVTNMYCPTFSVVLNKVDYDGQPWKVDLFSRELF